jgi:hypothetical protein
VKIQDTELGIANSDRLFQDGLKYWLQIAGRRIDYTQNVSSCRLLFQCFTEVGCALAQFVEQPRVLDGDDGLIGKGLEQGDLSLGEELRLDAAQRDHSYCDTFSHQRDVQPGAEAQASCVFAGYRKFIRSGLKISNMDGPLIKN